ncbi:hydantoinase/oxoprolinase family protein [Halobacteria archaeon AArc-dxtr1]|nr:hydantoinase/oxoprolinase family protein [Halobacteria archaeon AArc-dxtr1]
MAREEAADGSVRPPGTEQTRSADVRVGVDVGGTFTDVALSVGDRLVTAKVPTTDDQHVGVREGIAEACDRAGIEPADVDDFAHATTVSVNALLERDGARTALVTTAGFRDVLEIGRQNRPSLYDLDAEKPAPLVPRSRRIGVSERATPEGIEEPIDPEEIRAIAADLRKRDVEAVAVCFLHAYAEPENERVATEILRQELSVPVSVSHEVLAEFREFERTATTAADAYVRPAIDGYVGRLVEAAAEVGLPAPRIMRANGGTADAETVRTTPVTTTLSGPAAGVVGAGAIAGGDTAGGESRDDTAGQITFDMGGTSSDVSLVREGGAERTTEAEIDGIPIRTPMVDVTTVGAGGGSIARVDAGGALRVGPRSAGAEPGPACYGRGGTEPTVTDAAVVLGYIGPETELGGSMRLDVGAARDALAELADEAGLEGARAAAQGVYRVANATMTRAIRSVTVERGHDPRNLALVAFGGAGPMHAAALADALSVDRIVLPRPGGVLSAFGLLAADERHDAARTVGVALETDGSDRIEGIYDGLVADVLADASDPDRARIERAADCRYAGQSFELTVSADEAFDPATVAERFHAAHERAYGYRMDEAVEVVTLRATATIPGSTPPIGHDGGEAARLGTREATFPDAGTVETAVYDRDRLGLGATVSGPAILEQAESTAVLPPGWTGEILADGTVVASSEVEQ